MCTWFRLSGFMNILAIRVPSKGIFLPHTGHCLITPISVKGWQCGHPEITQRSSVAFGVGYTLEISFSPGSRGELHIGHLLLGFPDLFFLCFLPYSGIFLEKC